ncbi:acetyltransferase, GNAT family [Pseudovibrio sp. FO-BEG1]|uniref:Ribosomal protein S18 acetylase RimI n=1 Tax=Pseudovibrio denitrificans TaxID=258256 RepID=A0A1I7ANL4_9HYPH|nr:MULTISPECIES: GNAT family N-acetyltransferase [Pseudovibrio]AEV34752.1 acetyltransferase, GNAT family [Pseudovibrio sp. FO-BEG1]EEA94015.1 acetyltransferase, gnat family [Pseudovibrio sp. JE062]SFT76527.1 Ribosomal protein S18 acetylase RimI [Pseudovibrio denitrificans]
MADLSYRALTPADAPDLAPLIAENAQALKRGAPRRPDEVFAERLIEDKSIEIIGAFEEDTLVGFAAFFDIPDLISGLRIGQLDDIYVMPDHRHKGIGRTLVEQISKIGKERDWLHVRWLVPNKNKVDNSLFENLAEPDDKDSFIVPIDRLALA